MYKIKQVCELTGLTEKTVRYYVEQKLITPRTETGLHYKSYCFDDRDIARLRDITALRSAEFGISDIRRMLESPSTIAPLVAQKEAALRAKIDSLRAVQQALENLTLSDYRDASRVADGIAPQSVLRRETSRHQENRLLWLLVYAGVFLLIGLTAGGGVFRLLCLALLFLAGVEFPCMAFGYHRYNHRYRSLEHHAEGTVISVISDRNISDFWEESNLDILHGLMHLGFFHWNWIRPDHWVPLVQFSCNGETVTTAYRYGWMKHSWKAGDTVSVAWQEGKPLQIYPHKDTMLQRKLWTYLLTGMLCNAVFWGHVLVSIFA